MSSSSENGAGPEASGKQQKKKAEEEVVAKVPFLKLFSFADRWDCVLMAVGSLGACAHGASVPVFFIFFGKLINIIGLAYLFPTTVSGRVAKYSLDFVYLGIVILFSSWTEVACWMHTGERQAAKMRLAYLRAMLDQDIAVFDTEASTGEVINAITSDILVVQDAISEKTQEDLDGEGISGENDVSGGLPAHDLTMVSTDDSSSDDDTEELIAVLVSAGQVLNRRQKAKRVLLTAMLAGMSHHMTHVERAPYRVPYEAGWRWVNNTLEVESQCRNMFRMRRPCFDKLHHVLTQWYGLKGTRRMTSVESLGMFLWMCGDSLSFRQAENRMCRSKDTISRKFDEVLASVFALAADIVRPKDPEFRGVHTKLLEPRFGGYFDNCIGALDGTHVKVQVPRDEVGTHMGRKGWTSQNVLACCDFDMRFTFVVTGWPGSAHDYRVLKDTISRHADEFPHPPQGKYYLVDAGYPNKVGYLAPYKGTKYHVKEFQHGPAPRGRKEVFNEAHSSLRNVIERSFGVCKEKWRMMKCMNGYPVEKQKEIIAALFALHNFVRENDREDEDFCRGEDDNYVLEQRRRRREINAGGEEDDVDMNALRDWIARGLRRL